MARRRIERPPAGTTMPATDDGDGDIVVLPVGIEQIGQRLGRS
jgi:hypothetical protein